jgi:hypothetical protein
MTGQAQARDDGGQRYITPHDLPTPHERELLTILSEEAAEIIVAASKLQRFGRDDGYPGTVRTNGSDLGAEIGDLEELVDRIVAAGLTTRAAIAAGKAHKAKKLSVYLQTKAV